MNFPTGELRKSKKLQQIGLDKHRIYLWVSGNRSADRPKTITSDPLLGVLVGQAHPRSIIPDRLYECSNPHIGSDNEEDNVSEKPRDKKPITDDAPVPPKKVITEDLPQEENESDPRLLTED